MAAPPEKKDSTTICVIVEDWAEGQTEQFSPVYRINGYPFRVRIYRKKIFCAKLKTVTFDRYCYVSLICEKSRESKLWMCKATITQPDLGKIRSYPIRITFHSWHKTEVDICPRYLNSGDTLQFDIATDEDGESWRPILRPTIEPFDGVLVIGQEKKKIGVNKQSLASLSSYFDRLFFGNFKEKDMAEISIGDVEYEEFNNIIKMVYGTSGVLLTKDNVLRVLELADRFELKIVEDRAISCIFFSSFSVAQKLLLSQEKNSPLLKKLCLGTYIFELENVQNSPEYADFSDELKAEISDRIEARLRLFHR